MPEVRLIDANALKPEMEILNAADMYLVCHIIDNAPTIEPEVRYGGWHESWHTDTVCASICTNCGKATTQVRTREDMTNVRYPLCPNCGARMNVKEV